MGLFSRKPKDEEYRISFNLTDKKIQITEIKDYDKNKSLELFLEKENFSFADSKRILESSNPFEETFNILREPKSSLISEEYDRFKKIIILNSINDVKNDEIKYSTLNALTMYFSYLICMRSGVSYIGDKNFIMSEKKQFVIELSTDNPRAIMWFSDEVSTAMAIFLKRFNMTLPDLLDELLKLYHDNIGLPKSIIGIDNEFICIVGKQLELISTKKKYRVSNILK